MEMKRPPPSPPTLQVWESGGRREGVGGEGRGLPGESWGGAGSPPQPPEPRLSPEACGAFSPRVSPRFSLGPGEKALTDHLLGEARVTLTGCLTERLLLEL